MKDEVISDDIEVLLKSSNIKVLLLTIQLHDSLYLRLNRIKHVDILDKFLDYFKTVSDVNKQKILLKRIIEFIVENDGKQIFDRVKERSGIEFLFLLAKEKSLLSKTLYKSLMDYFHTFRLNGDETRILNSTIEDEETKKMIICINMIFFYTHYYIVDHELKSISYGKEKEKERSYYYGYGEKEKIDECKFTVNKEMNLIPRITEIVDVEEITIHPSIFLQYYV